jgi:hypothetical protein
MNESMLMLARSRGSELSQNAGQAQRAAQAQHAAQARHAARVRQCRPTPRPTTQSKTKIRTATTPRARRSGSWLATAVAWLRPTIAGR